MWRLVRLVTLRKFSESSPRRVEELIVRSMITVPVVERTGIFGFAPLLGTSTKVRRAYRPW